MLQVRCNKDSNVVCGHLGQYCYDCIMKPIQMPFNTVLYSTTPQTGWQSCPHCNGTGISQNSGTYNTLPTCTVCNGKKIISTITGQPPQ